MLQLLSQNSTTGGLAGLVQTFQKNGLADTVNSWVGTGQNLPMPPQQILQGLGSPQLQQVARQARLTSENASAQLAKLLPEIVDRLTPQGQLPKEDFLEQELGLLKGKFGL